MSMTQTRRRFLTALSGAGAVGLLQPQLLAAEGLAQHDFAVRTVT